MQFLCQVFEIGLMEGGQFEKAFTVIFFESDSPSNGLEIWGSTFCPARQGPRAAG